MLVLPTLISLTNTETSDNHVCKGSSPPKSVILDHDVINEELYLIALFKIRLRFECLTTKTCRIVFCGTFKK